MTSTVMPAVIEALIDLFEAATAEHPAKPKVVDGPDDVDLSLLTLIAVGVKLNDPRDGFTGEVEGDQSFPYIGARTKDETGTIPVSVLCWSGDLTTYKRRERAVELFQLCEAAHRKNIGLGVPELIDSSFGTSFRMNYMVAEQGNGVVLTFDVGFHAHLPFPTA